MFHVVALIAGIAVALQGTLNANLQARLGLGPALVVNSVVVLSGSLLIAWALGQGFPKVSQLQLPTYMLVGGGLCGLFIITAGILAFPRLGVATTISLVIGGQMLTAAVIDHFGLLGLVPHPFTVLRLAGLVMIFLGVLLMQLKL